MIGFAAMQTLCNFTWFGLSHPGQALMLAPTINNLVTRLAEEIEEQVATIDPVQDKVEFGGCLRNIKQAMGLSPASGSQVRSVPAGMSNSNLLCFVVAHF